MTNLVGSTLGQYQIVELIGEGGMASVYKAWQPNLRRYVALKVLAPHLTGDAEFVARFQQEAVSAANLRQSNIVTIHDVGSENGYHFIAMEYIEGASLEEGIRAQHALAPEQVVDIVSQVGKALDYAHQRGFIHRDIKPANVLIDPNGRAVLTDFGIVKALTGSGLTTSITKAGAIFGTPHYMSPEQIKEEPVDHRSDLYALGIVCYEMLSGHVPFDGTTTHAILYAQAHNPPPPLRQVNPAVPAAVDAVVNRMLAKQPQARYESAGEFATALAQAFAGRMPEAAAQWDAEATVVTGGRLGNGATVIGAPPGGIAPGLAGSYYPPAYTPAVPQKRSRWPLVVGAALVGLVLIAAVGVVVVFVLPSFSTGEDPLEKGQEALAVGDVVGAIVWLDKALGENPGDAEALEGLTAAAQKQVEAGEHAAAIDTFKKVLIYDADNVGALKGIGAAYEAQEQWLQAADWYEKWTQVAPDDAEARLRLGEVYSRLEDYELAIAQLKRVTTLRPDWSRGWEVLSKVYYHKLNQYDNATEPLRKWSELEPENVEAQLTLGWTMFFQKEYSEAEAYFQRCLELDEDNGCYRGLVAVYRSLGKWQEALSHLEYLSEKNPSDATVFLSLGDTLYNLKDYNAAVENYLKTIELDKTNVQAYQGLAKCYVATEDYLKAKNAYEQLVTLIPNDPQAQRSLGWVLYELEDYQAAIQAFERASALDTNNPNAYLGLADSYRALDNGPRAVQFYEKWASLTDGNPFTHQQYGRLYFGLGQYGAAIQAFLRALALDSQFVSGYIGLGQAQQAQGDCSGAKANFERALEIDPNNESAKRGLEECDQ